MATPFDTLFGGSTSYTPNVGGFQNDWMLDPRLWLENLQRLQAASSSQVAPTVAPVQPSAPLHSSGSLAVEDPDSLMGSQPGVPAMVAPQPGTATFDQGFGKMPGPQPVTAPAPAPAPAPASLGLQPGQSLMPGVGVGTPPTESPFSPASRVASGAGAPPSNIEGFLDRLIQIESGGDPTRLSPSGRYRGLGQFSRDLERQYGITEENWRDPDVQRGALRTHVGRLMTVLRSSLGREPTFGEIYLAHQQGPAGGPALLTAPEGATAYDTLRRFYGTENEVLTAIFNNIPDGHPLKGGLLTQRGGRLPQGAAEVARAVQARDFASLWTSRFGDTPQAQPGFTATGYTPGADMQALSEAGGPGGMLSPGALSQLGAGPQIPGMGQVRAPIPGAPGTPSTFAGPPPRPSQDGNWLARALGVRPPPVAGNVFEALMGAPSPTGFLGAQQQAAAAVFARGQQLRLENPDATPDQLQRMLMRDPVWGQNAISLGNNAAAAMRAAVNPPPPQDGQFTIGATRYDAHGRPIVTGAALPPDQQRVTEWLLSLGPEDRAQALAMIRPGTSPSDREQAISRIEQSRTRGMPASIHDLNLAGYLVRVPHLNAAGATIGERVFDMYSQRYLTPAEGQGLPPNSVPLIPSQVPGQPPAPPGGPGAPGAVPGPPPPVAAPGAPPNLADAGVFTPSGDINPPITPSRLQEFQEFLAQHGGMAPNPLNNPMSPFNLFAGMSRQIDGSEAQAGSPGQRPARTPPVEVGPPPSTVAGPRVFRTQSGREYIDVPELSLKSVLVDDPTDMFTGVGVAEAATRAITRGTAQIPGQAGSGEAAQTRGVMLDRLRAAVASYQEGVRLAGEHSLLIATVPSSSDLWSNPVRALAQAIELRRQVVEELATMIDAGRDQTTSEAARSAANLRAQRLRSILRAMPTMEAMIARRERLISGEENPRGVDVQGLTGDITKGVGAITGGATGAPKGSPSLFNSERPVTSYSPSELNKILDRPNISAADALAIQDEMLARIRRGRTKTGN